MKTKKSKMDALKVQLNFRRKVLSQESSNKQLFQLSHNHRAFSVEEITQNLCKLLLPPPEPTALLHDQVQKDPELLLYRRIKHKFECNGADQWFYGTVMSYNKDSNEFRVAQL